MTRRAGTVADALCQALVQGGVQHVFGLPGARLIPLFEALRRSRLRTVVPTHETAAGFMANGYFRASGRVSVVVAIPGPGFTYLLPSLAEARLDDAAVLAVVGAPLTGPGGQPGLQAIPQLRMARPLVKEYLQATAAATLPALVRQALEACQTGRPGPVVLEVPPDLLGAPASRPGGRQIRRTSVPELPPAVLSQLQQRLADARRIILILGQGAAAAAPFVRQLAERLSPIIVATTSGRGIVPDEDERALVPDRLPGGWEAVLAAVARSDLVLALGCGFSHNGSAGHRLVPPADRLIRVDTSAEALAAGPPASLTIQADVADVLRSLTLPARPPLADWRPDAWTATPPKRGEVTPPEPRFANLVPGDASGFFAALRAALPERGILVTDSGLHQMLARRHFPVRSPRGLIAPTDFQSMGFGLPAALGAALAQPDRPVVALVGDGGLRFAVADLATAAAQHIPVTVIVFADGVLGLIREQQRRDYGQEHGVALPPLDLASIARACGVDHTLLRGDPTELLASAVAAKRPILLEARLHDPPGTGRRLLASRARSAARRTLGPYVAQEIRRYLGRPPASPKADPDPSSS